MRSIAAMSAVMCCVMALGQPAAQPARGMDFHYTGPKADVFAAFVAALGLGVVPKIAPRPPLLEAPEGEEPVTVTVQDGRVFDIVLAIEKAVGRGVGFEDVWPQPTFSVSRDARTSAALPRTATPDFDVVVERVEQNVSRSMTWRIEGPQCGPVEIGITPTVRIYPSGEQAAERFVGIERPGMTVVHPDGKEEATNCWANWYNLSSSMATCLRAMSAWTRVAADGVAGTYKLRGVMLVAKVAPVVAPSVKVAEVGKEFALGAAKVTIREWVAGEHILKWELDGPKPGLSGTPETPTGVIWIEARGRGADGRVLWLTGSDRRVEGTRCDVATTWEADPVTVEFRALIIARAEDVMAEPFEVTFTVPADFVGK